MIFSVGPFRRWIFGLALREISAKRRGFPATLVTPRLDRVASSVVAAYNDGLEYSTSDDLMLDLGFAERELQGFAHEGAAMALAALDLFSFGGPRRLLKFSRELAPLHSYMAYVGAGLAVGVFHRSIERFMAPLDPFTRWLVVDGYGFQRAYFNTEATVRRHRVPSQVRGFAQSCFDSGMGRGLWFIDGADPQRIAATISAFPEERRPGLWAGVGLACAYAGGVNGEVLSTLKKLSAHHELSLGLGVVLAAHTRVRAGNPAPHVELACRVICERSIQETHELALETMEGLSDRGERNGEPTWGLWRDRIRERLSSASMEMNKIA